MPTYTVHEPPARNAAPEPERFVFVRDGFHFWAFLLAPLWLLVYRQWLALLLYLVAAVLLTGLFVVFGLKPPLRFVVGVLVGLLVGFEAASIRRWTLARRGWRTVGLVVGDDEEMAERRFYAEWIARKDVLVAASAPSTPPVRRGPPSGQDVIGLFPEPEKPR